jgi:hypothetical protein
MSVHIISMRFKTDILKALKRVKIIKKSFKPYIWAQMQPITMFTFGLALKKNFDKQL